jgi:hypothetical protein
MRMRESLHCRGGVGVILVTIYDALHQFKAMSCLLQRHSVLERLIIV